MATQQGGRKQPDQQGGTETQSKWRGWAVIVLLAVAIVAFVALGSMDAETRYELIGV